MRKMLQSKKLTVRNGKNEKLTVRKKMQSKKLTVKNEKIEKLTVRKKMRKSVEIISKELQFEAPKEIEKQL